MTKELKFRQAIFKDGKFHHWHYWGYGIAYHPEEFVGPIEIRGIHNEYEVKESQQYTGTHCMKLGLGCRIYEGDRVQPLGGTIINTVCWEDGQFVLKWLDGHTNIRLGEALANIHAVIGDIYENPIEEAV